MSDTRPRADLLIRGASEVVTCAGRPGDPLGRLPGASVAVLGEQIVAVGPQQEIAAAIDVSAAEVVDAAGCVVAPGFVDSHTHLVFGGSRAQEYAARLTRTREEVEGLGIPTGIRATVEMTRGASREELFEGASRRLGEMLRHGTTTVESKSGYGLSTASELRLLEINSWLDAVTPMDVVSTFLGAHDVPREESRTAYLRRVTEEMIPEVARQDLAEFCDVFCDASYYDVEQARLVLESGRRAGLRLKIHTDQYSAIGGATLAAELEVVSADHLNHADRPSLARLAEAGVVAVGTPVLDFAVAHPRPFDARAMLEEGLTLAIATDLCPGCWAESMQLAAQFACRAHGLSPAEAMLAATDGGARALGLEDRGRLAPGLLADIQIWDVSAFEEMAYRWGHNAVARVIKRGKVVDL